MRLCVVLSLGLIKRFNNSHLTTKIQRGVYSHMHIYSIFLLLFKQSRKVNLASEIVHMRHANRKCVFRYVYVQSKIFLIFENALNITYIFLTYQSKILNCLICFSS